MVYVFGDAGHIAEHNQIDLDLIDRTTSAMVATQITAAIAGELVGLTGPPGEQGLPGADGSTTISENVMSHGAIGDGVADDTAAIHAARDAANTAGLPVHLPKGTYLTTGLALNVAGQLWDLAPGAVVKLADATTVTGVVIITGAGVTFRGGKIDGNRPTQTYLFGPGINVQAPAVTVEGCEITNVLAGGITLLTAAVGCLIQNNWCHDNGSDTNAPNGIITSGATRCRIIGNRCENNGTVGNEALYDGNGIYLAGGTVVGHNLVANNQCSYNARRGIKVQELGATITGNVCVLNSCGIGVTVSPNPTNTPMVISGNTIKDSTLQGLQLDRCAFVTVTGNNISDSGSHGVGASQGTNYVTFSGNSVVRSGRNGVHLAFCSDWAISGNTMLDNGQLGTDTFGLKLDATGGACSRMNIVGNISHNSGAGTAQTHGFVAGTAATVNLCANMAISGLSVPYSTASATGVTLTGNV